MTLRQKLYESLGFFIDKDENLSEYLWRLDRKGQLDEKAKLKILMALVAKVEELEK